MGIYGYGLWAMVMGYGVMVWDIHGGYSYGDGDGHGTWACIDNRVLTYSS